MKNYNALVIGFGKAGKTLAATLSKRGEKVALVEQSDKMYGGTCINIACIPTKTLEYKSRKSRNLSTWEEKEAAYLKAIVEKRNLIEALRKKNYDKVDLAGVEIIDGKASFTGERTVEILKKDGSKEEVSADKILINTGAVSRKLKIAGIENSSLVYDSTAIMELEKLPKHLVVLGAGFIGLEFASYYANFGSKVTVLQQNDVFMPGEDRQIAEEILKDFRARGIEVVENSNLENGSEDEEGLHLTIDVKGEKRVLDADGLLVAIGRVPNTEGLNLEKAGIELDERGAIKVDNQLRTSNTYVWAAGDVKGGLQFTYISLDDFRIIRDQMIKDGRRSTDNRNIVPKTLFIDPPYARVGMSEEEATNNGYKVKTSILAAAGIPKAHILENTRGLLKLVLEEGTEAILGAHFYCAQSEELIHIVQLAMEHNIPYSDIRENIFAHPTMSEALNDL